MNSENIKILGHYSFEAGNSISLSMGNNMELGTGSATQIHEMCHMNLTNRTNLGFLLQILSLEQMYSKAEDKAQFKKIEKLIRTIYQRTHFVQEVYANSVELLLIGELGSKDSANRIYDLKTNKYKEYSDYLNVIKESSQLDFIKKQILINNVCMYAMNTDICSESFLSALREDRLVDYFSKQNHPKQRLQFALNYYKEGLIEDLKDEYSKTITKMNLKYFFSRIKEYRIVKYVDITEMINFYDELLSNEKSLLNNIELHDNLYKQELEKSIKVFDFSITKVIRGFSVQEQGESGLFIVKNCLNLDDYNKNFYVIGHMNFKDEPIYTGNELNELEIQSALNNVQCVAVYFEEYDTKNCNPKYFRTNGKPVIVLIDNYKDCYNWLKEELISEDIHIGDLYRKEITNFFTVIFISKRNDPNTLFIFPTIKSLGTRLISELNLHEQILYSDQHEFLKLLSCFNDEPTMLITMQWLLAFITNSKGKFSSLEDSATKLNFDLIRTLMNSVLQIKRKNYYKLLAALPTKKTKASPFYALMEFDGEHNTGKIFTETEENLLIFFHKKEDAHIWRSRRKYFKNQNLSCEIVGIDNFYWRELGRDKVTDKVLLCINSNVGFCSILEYNDVDKVIY
ncbi:hypothetical protein [Paenibacillus polymyxa]|uniref:hypothetical protein n=1 Tax=Paenibacillus polymyxa TaxID=1406 RepID=UPI00298C45D9|nr:hypothetical protein [Paenibacillus polymyxa]